MIISVFEIALQLCATEQVLHSETGKIVVTSSSSFFIDELSHRLFLLNQSNYPWLPDDRVDFMHSSGQLLPHTETTRARQREDRFAAKLFF